MTGWPSLASSNSDKPVTGTTSVIHVLPTPTKEKVIRLGTLRQVRFQLAEVYREARQGKLDKGDATKLTYMLQVLANMIVDHELEEKLNRLENK